MLMITNILIAVIAYLLGSIPFAFLLVKIKTGKNISTIGSGNVGAMNTYDTTKSKSLAIVVLLLDALKGVAAVYIAFLIKPEVISIALASIFSVFGHNFSAFLKLKGGRGLATGAGVFAIVNPIVIVIWGLMFLAGWFIVKKNVHVANVTATVCTPLMLFYTPPQFLAKTSLLMDVPATSLLIFGSVLCFIILVKHVQPLIDLYKNTGIETRQK